MSEALIEFRDVSKSFGESRALTGVSFAVQAGHVHVLAGENGAGKSTLIRILSGVYADYGGELWTFGARTRFRSPQQARQAGIATIHQELSLVGALSVADNLLLAEPGGFWSALAPRSQLTRAQRLLDELGLEVAADSAVESLPLSMQQQIEIARALQRKARVFVMDEPTSSLGEHEAERLFARIAQLTRQGCAVIYISHRMEEMFRLADRITVLRDGRHILTATRAELDPERLVAAMVGDRARRTEAVPRAAPGPVLLEASELTVRDRARPERCVLDRVSFSVRRAEIVGLAGLAGSGTSELLHVLFGSYGKVEHGQMRLAAQPFAPREPSAALAQGVALLANDRRLNSLGELSIAQNVTLSSLRRWSRFGWIRRGEERAATRDALGRFAGFGGVGRSGPVLDGKLSTLSGGNRQKIALARCLMAEPRVLLLDEPTRGIDVAAKADVYASILAQASRGLSVLLVASELEELLEVADRILVLQRGRIGDELARSEFSRERVLASAMGARA